MELFDATLRLHVPVVTSDAASMFVNGSFYRMRAGEVWQMNNFCSHSAINNHAHLARIHLVIDVEPDAELLRLLYEGDANSGFHDKQTYRRLYPPVSLKSRVKAGVRLLTKRD